MNVRVFVFAMLPVAVLGPATAQAEKADHNQPVYLAADRSRVDDLNKVAVYEGQVVMTRGTMQMQADRVEVQQDAQGFKFSQAFGKPAYFRQLEDNGDLVEGWGKRIDYDGRVDLVKLIGEARLKRADEQEVHGSEVHYRIQEQVYHALGASKPGEGGRVIAVIKPKPEGKASAKAVPAGERAP